jgi:hypothetical protein
MFPTIAFPPMSPFQGPRPILETAGGQSALTSGPAPVKSRVLADVDSARLGTACRGSGRF